MKATTATYKQIISSKGARTFLHKIDLELADETILHLTGEDIWQDSFSIETASSGTSTFDLGTAVIGQCKFTINNIDGDFDSYDFYNASATVWLGLEGDVNNDTQQYYRMGFYTVDEPKKATGLISLTLLDNMWKFDRPLSGVTINYPATCLTIVQAICTYCGVTLSGTSASFHGYNFSVAEAPKDVANMNCREMLQYVAMIGCNFCTINSNGQLEIKWYDTSATASTTDVFDTNMSSSFDTDEITITGVKFVIENTEYRIGTTGYVLELSNPLVTASNVNSVLNLIWDVLDGFTLHPFAITTACDLAVEIGDKCKIKDYKGNDVYSWVTLNTFKTAGQQVQCNAQAPNRQLIQRYSKTVQAAVEVARQQTNQIISNYDLAVQEFNKLVEQAMGAYTDYEDAPTGGRYYYISNMPITKSAQGVCSFQPNSIVYKMAGDVFSISRDGGITWFNGYDPTTGELIVNVLDAIGINFDWARGGTLTLGGYGNGNGVLSIQDATNVEKVHGDNTGLKVGSTVGSRIHINTSGEMEYDYNDAYSGKIRMRAKNYGTEQSPDIRDTFAIEDFNTINLNADDYATIDICHTSSGQSGEGYVEISASDGSESQGLKIQPDGIYIYGELHPASNTTGQFTSAIYVGSDGNLYRLDFDCGICYEHEQVQGGFGSTWHTWSGSQEGVVNVAIILGVGVTQAVFPETDSNLSYEPFIQCADGVEPPLLEGISFSSGSCTVRFTAVTAAQAGSGGSSCVIKLREFF